MAVYMKNEDYAYAVARIRANENHLLSRSDIEALITAEGFDETVSLLYQKGWIQKNADEFSIAGAVRQQNQKLWTLLSESVPEKKELEIFTVQNDFFNIKAALKCLFSKKEADSYFAYPASLDTSLIKQAVISRDFSVLGSEFASYAKQAYDVLNQTKTGQMADIILDKAALSYMKEKSRKNGCELVKDITDFLCTCANIKIAVRCAKTKKSLSFAREAVAACGDIDCELLAQKASEGENELYSFLETTAYKKAAQLIGTDTAAFEKWVDDEVTEKTKAAKLVFFGFEPVAAYFYAKSTEIKTVRLILCAKESGLGEDIIRERVREQYV